MPLISQLANQVSDIQNEDTIILEREGSPLKITGENFKIQTSNLIIAPIEYYFYGFFSGYRTSETYGEFYLFAKSLLENAGYNLSINKKSSALPIYTIISEAVSEKGWMYHEFDVDNNTAYIKVAFKDSVASYERLSTTPIDIRIKSYYGKIIETEGWFRDVDYPIITSQFSGADLRNSKRYENITEAQDLVLGINIVTNPTFVSGTNWTSGSAWSFSTGGSAVYDASIDDEVSQNVGLIKNEIYKITFDVDSTGTMELGILDGSENILVDYNDFITGSYIKYFQAKDSSTIKLSAFDEGASGSVNNFLVIPFLDFSTLSSEVYITKLQDQKATNNAIQTIENDQPMVKELLSGAQILDFSSLGNLVLTTNISFLTSSNWFLSIYCKFPKEDEIICNSSLSSNNVFGFEYSTNSIYIIDSTGTKKSITMTKDIFINDYILLTFSSKENIISIYKNLDLLGTIEQTSNIENINSIGSNSFTGEISNICYSIESNIEEDRINNLEYYNNNSIRTSFGISNDEQIGLNENELIGR